MRNKPIIYIIEDDPTIVQLLTGHLHENYQVKSVDNFRAIKQEVENLEPDLILMDISLPYFNGFYWTTEIRKHTTIPILFISSSNDEMSTIMALDMGGDDVLNKPFSLNILEAKLTALLRRSQQFSSPQGYSFKHFHLDLDGRFSDGGSVIRLTPTETRILSQLMKTPGQVISKDKLLEVLWENDEFIDQNALHVNITRLRKKLQALNFHHIHTIRGVGYVIQ